MKSAKQFVVRPSVPLASYLSAAVASMLVALPALAQYKVVGPDGKVTYTDRPPAAAAAPGAKVTPARGGTSNEVALPLDVRQAAERFPVTLYSSPDCGPCATGRQLLRARGVPFNERTVTTLEDGEALQRLAGTRDLPVLTIGGQTLNGLSPEVWNSYLDSAAYPRESRLPANYSYPAAAPLVTRQAAAAPAPRAAQAPAPAAAAEPAPAASGIRF